MSTIQTIAAYSSSSNLQTTANVKSESENTAQPIVETTEAAVSYDSKSNNKTEAKTYTPDLEKIRSLKAETEQHLVDVLLKTSAKGLIKQLGGLRAVIDKLISGETVDEDFEVTPESIQKAQEEVGPGGYWSPEMTSDRFLEFAKALSGDDPSKANLLLDAFKKGYEEATKIWGGELPEISKKTYDLTLEKFEQWANSTPE